MSASYYLTMLLDNLVTTCQLQHDQTLPLFAKCVAYGTMSFILGPSVSFV